MHQLTRAGGIQKTPNHPPCVSLRTSIRSFLLASRFPLSWSHSQQPPGSVLLGGRTTPDKCKINSGQPELSWTCSLKTNPQAQLNLRAGQKLGKKSLYSFSTGPMRLSIQMKSWEQLLPRETKGHKPARKLCLRADRTAWLTLQRVIFINKKIPTVPEWQFFRQTGWEIRVNYKLVSGISGLVLKSSPYCTHLPVLDALCFSKNNKTGKKANLFLIGFICDYVLEPKTCKPTILCATTKSLELRSNHEGAATPNPTRTAASKAVSLWLSSQACYHKH